LQTVAPGKKFAKLASPIAVLMFNSGLTVLWPRETV
jgi:hypothetical protein